MNDVFRVVGRYIVETGDAKKSIDEVTESAKDSESKFSGAFSGMGKAVATFGKVALGAVAVASTAIIGMTKSAVDAYGQYEQLVGGVETLFKDSADKLMQYANIAYATAGLSANQYMEQATSFSASLLQGLGGDTDKAVELANLAIIDMSDNANKMGTNIQMIQNAYQGFAKQNYMMLDNLKLGYGGTKTEMERLLADANALNAQQGKFTDYQIGNFADMIEAIHVIQTNIGITGTTSLEAEKTITGSMGAVRASWQNLMVAMADENQDVGKILDILGKNIITMLGNIMPRIQTVFSKIPEFIKALAPLIMQAMGDLLPTLISSAISLVSGLIQALPSFITIIYDAIPVILDAFRTLFDDLQTNVFPMLQDLASGFIEAIPSFIDSFIQITQSIAQTIADNMPVVLKNFLTGLENLVDLIAQNLPYFIQGGINILKGIAKGIADSIPMLIETVPQIITKIANLINDNAPTILRSGIDILLTLIKGIISAIPTLIANIPKIIEAIVSVITAYNWINLGSKLINWMKDGIMGMKGSIVDGVKNIAQSIRDWITSIWNAITGDTVSKWNAIKEAIISPVTKAKDMVKGLIDKIRGFFNFEWSLPKLKLPHLSISGGFSLLPPSVPKFSIDWYAKAMENPMILDQATIFGVDKNGQLMGGGESGEEIVSGKDTLMNMISSAVGTNLNAELLEVLKSILERISDENKIHDILVDALTDGSFAVVLDNREVGRIVKKYA